MCGRYFIADPQTDAEIRKICDDINFRYQSADRSAFIKTGEIYPTDHVPVLVRENDKPTAVLMNWGFPRPAQSGVIINARAETASLKPMFCGSVSSRRCLIPASGFYEWSHENGKAGSKFLLRSDDAPLLLLAGLYSIFEKAENTRYAAFVILTVDANESVRRLHDRMPLLVPNSELTTWLSDERYARELLLAPCRQVLIGSEA